jgi:hypothetical protein
MKRSAWTGWVVFAGVMMLVTGAINVIEGIVALIRRNEIVLAPDHFYVVNLTSWGWTVLIFGAVVGLTGIGLLFGQTWARILGIVVVGLHAVAQVLWISAYPLWSLAMLALDTVVLFALTAKWPGSLDEDEEYPDADDRQAQHSADRYHTVGR